MVIVRTPICPSCNKRADIYVLKYDAYACFNCNVWIDHKCSDDCEFCSNRPAEPISLIIKKG